MRRSTTMATTPAASISLASSGGRPQDNIGLGYAYLPGGSLDIDYTHVAEAYVRFILNDYLAVTFDLQYMDDEFKDGGGDPEGFIRGGRVALEF